ncbi:phage tail sheath C-terminal domain-containing protein [Vibrio parahaemolyticus]|uniref:phage tail sheath C-terminal domain-containing protein n=1 Tax=Vibrio parahaemolyticus TaxID=670 RepID=UPI001D1698FE|nr:phage tail sheath C-terminal domain-containing protein [Vibrio parahaemolyticus]MCC3798267.1 phage tail protein [Vibrio parahaemolyticus]
MSGNYVHGVETFYLKDGNRPITVLAASTIGLVATAPNAQVATAAALTLGEDNSSLTFEAVNTGIRGNGISIELVDPAANDAALSVSVKDEKITVLLATGADGSITSTATDVAAAVNAHDEANDLVSVTAGGDGAGVVEYAYPTYLSGGENEAFPLNVPTLVTSDKMIAKAGTGGTLKDALKDIYSQVGAVVIVVRVAEGQDENTTKANVIGTIDPETSQATGLKALEGAEGKLGVRPRLVIAPEFSHLAGVGEEVERVAKNLNATPIIDSDHYAGYSAVVKRARQFAEALFVHGGIDLFDSDLKANVKRHASAIVAGHIVRVDNEEGYWNSPSNRKISGIQGTAIDIPYVSAGPGAISCMANQLNSMNVCTIVNKQGGWFFWGNRLTNGTMLPHQRVRYIVGDSIVYAHFDAVDQNITKNYVESVTGRVNAFLRRLVNRQVISGGLCWADKELNIDAIGTGQVFFDYDLGFYDVAERVTFRQHINNSYNEAIFS